MVSQGLDQTACVCRLIWAFVICTCPKDFFLMVWLSFVSDNSFLCFTALECAEGEMKCEVDKKCIPPDQICNRVYDCSDGRDEIECRKLFKCCYLYDNV